MSNFDLNAILRGAQLTLVGAYRALQNPKLFNNEHYQQAALAVGAGLLISFLVWIPTFGIRVIVKLVALFSASEQSTWDDDIMDGLEYIEHSVLQVPFLLMSLMRYITPTLDNMFMESLQWVDTTYYRKHQSDDPTNLRATYYENLKQYDTHGAASTQRKPKEGAKKGAMVFLKRYARRTGISLAIYAASFLPVVGKFVLPAASFYTFKNAVGTQPAVGIFAVGIFVPRKVLVSFLQTYFASRSLMRELLEPYFSRITFEKDQKRLWFKDREGVLFGFGVGFYLIMKIPLFGVLVYGIAEASTAYLITKITDPPPPPSDSEGFSTSQVRWTNKHEFLNLSMDQIDALNAEIGATKKKISQSEGFKLPGKKYS
ncbi:hypothetical protein K402DRAFT_328161 [Aulographum hederae CBS 113979]|uniref:Transmembrane protein UsgS n=1 Tax=Aulographum hederae CBS 113979 TaxID=1176131 RepID=A0A6G1H709_9PEZI|nr:hypothetical protein K402DRAFT_328161 [Aulographum hederae CBS 113979]